MLIDARTVRRDSRLQADVCIIGAGAAGISLALELAAAGRRLIVLEAGGLRYEKASQQLLAGDPAESSYADLRETRFAGLGGATNLWAGWCRTLDPLDLAERSWVPLDGWPLTREDLEACYRRAWALCGIANADCGATLPSLLPADAELASVHFHRSPLRFGSAYRDALDKLPGVDVYLHAPVLRLVPAAGSDAINHAAAATLGGGRFEVAARYFVLAAGGIENARILMLSGDSPQRCVGNDHDLVGRYFTEHGFVDAGIYVPHAAAGRPSNFYFPHVVATAGGRSTVRGALAATPETLFREKLLNAAIFFYPAYESHVVFTQPEVRAMLQLWEKIRGRDVGGGYASLVKTAARAPGKLATAVARRLSDRRTPAYWRLRALFECVPDRDHRVTLGHGQDALGRPQARVNWRASDEDLYSIARTHGIFDQAVRAAGLGQLELLRSNDEWRDAAESGKHHMGATRMHADPARGVVDVHCKVHGIHNLFVAGSSVFPTGGYANPTLTIVALAVRLADHLQALLKGS